MSQSSPISWGRAEQQVPWWAIELRHTSGKTGSGSRQVAPYPSELGFGPLCVQLSAWKSYEDEQDVLKYLRPMPGQPFGRRCGWDEGSQLGRWGFSIRLDNVNTLCSTSCFFGPISSNLILILVWPSRRSTQGHCQSETNELCVICQQIASRQLKGSQLRVITEILNLQQLALSQCFLLACFQEISWQY